MANLSMGFAIVILTLLGILVTMAIIVWWTETRACENCRNSEDNKFTTLRQSRASGPVGLGITMQSAKEGKRENRLYERLRGLLSRLSKKAWLVDTMERWLNVVVAKLRDELDTDAEEGLLLPVQEIERVGGAKDQFRFQAGNTSSMSTS
jgi:hypothetical protein